MNEVQERMEEVNAVVGWMSHELESELKKDLEDSRELKPNIGRAIRLVC